MGGVWRMRCTTMMISLCLQCLQRRFNTGCPQAEILFKTEQLTRKIRGKRAGQSCIGDVSYSNYSVMMLVGE